MSEIKSDSSDFWNLNYDFFTKTNETFTSEDESNSNESNSNESNSNESSNNKSNSNESNSNDSTNNKKVELTNESSSNKKVELTNESSSNKIELTDESSSNQKIELTDESSSNKKIDLTPKSKNMRYLKLSDKSMTNKLETKIPIQEKKIVIDNKKIYDYTIKEFYNNFMMSIIDMFKSLKSGKGFGTIIFEKNNLINIGIILVLISILLVPVLY
jgi:hypothetical protein